MMHARSKSHVATGLTRISAEDVGPLVLLQDSFHHAALPLLPAILRDSGTKNRAYCMVCCERPSSSYSELASRFPGDGGRFFVEGSTLAAQFKDDFVAEVVDSLLKTVAHAQPGTVILILDSLSSLLPHGADGHAAATLFRRILTACKQRTHIEIVSSRPLTPQCAVWCSSRTRSATMQPSSTRSGTPHPPASPSVRPATGTSTSRRQRR